MKIKLEPVYNDKVFIIGGGPSIKDTNLDLIKDYPVIGTNAAYTLGNWVDICTFIDGHFYTWNQKELDAWPNRIITCNPNFKNHKKIEYLKKCEQHAMCWNPNKLPCPDKGKNVGSTAIALAAKLGAKKIILLGYDMKVKGGQHNYHKKHRHVPRNDVYYRFLIHFKALAAELKNTDIQVLNATPDSALSLFPKVSLKEALNK
jgi:hypothetical protein